MRLAALLLGLFATVACIAQTKTSSAYRWTTFVQVEGQPEPVPAEWVSTPEGKFAHSIKIPNPVPKDSGYRRGMSSKEYFEHLCKQEAGEFIFSKAENVDGLLFMRPPVRPTDEDLMDRRKLEAPSFERIYQLLRPQVGRRGAVFVEPPFSMFRFYEEPADATKDSAMARGYFHASGIDSKLPRLNRVERIERARSQYGVVWRGVRRPNDREHAIAGTEILVIEIDNRQVMGVLREYGITGNTTNVREGIWWLNAGRCPQFAKRYPSNNSKQLYEFVASILIPKP